MSFSYIKEKSIKAHRLNFTIISLILFEKKINKTVWLVQYSYPLVDSRYYHTLHKLVFACKNCRINSKILLFYIYVGGRHFQTQFFPRKSRGSSGKNQPICCFTSSQHLLFYSESSKKNSQAVAGKKNPLFMFQTLVLCK